MYSLVQIKPPHLVYLTFKGNVKNVLTDDACCDKN